jgi:hypothetical protein
MPIPEAVRTLERELRGVFGSRLQSLVMYGNRNSSRPEDHGAHGPPRAPIHTMALVEALSGDDLRACAERMASWHSQSLATPLLVTVHEFESALDAFPLEFGAILADHAVVSGASPFGRLTVDPADVRRAVEVQARSHLLHLREGYLETRGRSDALAVLIVQSAAPFAALLTSVARLEGRTDHDAAAAGRHVEHALGLAGGTVTDIVALAEVHEISSAEAERLFPPYLDASERLVSYVDGWGARD